MARLWLTWAERRDAKQEAQRQAALIADYRAVFGTEPGQRVLADILRRAGIMQSSFQGDGDAAANYREGRRRLGLEIVETINRDPAAQIRTAATGDTENLFHDDA